MQDRKPSGKYTIDRFEQNLAVLLYSPDEAIKLLLERSTLPEEAEEGSILLLHIQGNDLTSITYLKEETDRVRKQNKDLLQRLIR